MTLEITREEAQDLLWLHGLACREGWPEIERLVGLILAKFPELERDNYYADYCKAYYPENQT